MFRLPVVRRFRRTLACFAAARQGNVAVLFAIALVPMIGLVDVAVDYGRAVKARTSMQAALDSTALMLSRDLTQGTISASDITDTKATNYFKALYTDAFASDPSNSVPIHVSVNYTAASSTAAAKIVLTASGSVPTQFMRMLSILQNPGGPALTNSNVFGNLGFSATSTTTWGNLKMRVALALDNTGSMAQDGKIARSEMRSPGAAA